LRNYNQGLGRGSKRETRIILSRERIQGLPARKPT